MIFNYGINQKEGKKLIHKNGKIDVPHITWEDDHWEDEHKIIRDAIQKKHPGWAITGYAPAKV